MEMHFLEDEKQSEGHYQIAHYLQLRKLGITSDAECSPGG
jgi:hypothetical protein